MSQRSVLNIEGSWFSQYLLWHIIQALPDPKMHHQAAWHAGWMYFIFLPQRGCGNLWNAWAQATSKGFWKIVPTPASTLASQLPMSEPNKVPAKPERVAKSCPGYSWRNIFDFNIETLMLMLLYDIIIIKRARPRRWTWRRCWKTSGDGMQRSDRAVAAATPQRRVGRLRRPPPRRK